jgi:hypothetical protein
MDAGDTFVTAATVGSMNCVSRYCAMPLIMSFRTTLSADGFEIFASSSEMTMIPAAFAMPSVALENCRLPTGFGAPSPTHAYVPPPV